MESKEHDRLIVLKEHLRNSVGSAISAWEDEHGMWVVDLNYHKDTRMKKIEIDVSLVLPKGIG